MKNAKASCAAIVLIWLFAGLQSAFAFTISGRVVGVADGDTVTVIDAAYTQYKVRLAQIDAPEKSQPFGQRSKQSLSDLVFGKTVSVDVIDTDRYGRQVGTITADSRNVNQEQIRRGLAWVYRQYAKDPALLVIEEEARRSRRGLWVDESPLEPWLFRKQAKSSSR